MRQIILLLAFVIISSAVSAQNDKEPKRTDTMGMIEPEFAGNSETSDIQEFLLNNLCHPQYAHKCGIEGTEIIQFKVSPSGNLSEFSILNSVSSECDDAVISALESTGGMWNPGTIDGLPVPMQMKITVIFKSEGIEMYKTAQLNKVKADGFLKEGRYKRALKYYNLAIKSCPHHAVPYYRRGMAKYHLGDFDGALNDFNKVADLGSNMADSVQSQLHEIVAFVKNEEQKTILEIE